MSQLGYKDYVIPWPLDGINSPCFDTCHVATVPGVFAAGGTLFTTPQFQLKGYYQVEVCVAHESPGGFQNVVALTYQRVFGVSTEETVELFQAAGFSNADRNTFILDMVARSVLILRSLNGFQAGDTSRSCLRTKYLGR